MMKFWKTVKNIVKNPRRTDEERKRLVNEALERQGGISRERRYKDLIDKVLDSCMSQKDKDSSIESLTKSYEMVSGMDKLTENRQEEEIKIAYEKNLDTFSGQNNEQIIEWIELSIRANKGQDLPKDYRTLFDCLASCADRLSRVEAGKS